MKGSTEDTNKYETNVPYVQQGKSNYDVRNRAGIKQNINNKWIMLDLLVFIIVRIKNVA